MFQEEGSTSAREWTDKMQSQDRCVLICEFIIREEMSETSEISAQQSCFWENFISPFSILEQFSLTGPDI